MFECNAIWDTTLTLTIQNALEQQLREMLMQWQPLLKSEHITGVSSNLVLTVFSSSSSSSSNS